MYQNKKELSNKVKKEKIELIYKKFQLNKSK